MKRLVAVTVPLMLTWGIAVPASATINSHVTDDSCLTAFPDVHQASNFYESVSWMACAGISGGFADGNFGVSKSLTRGQAASFLHRLSGESFTPPAVSSFRDGERGGTHYSAIEWLKSKGYTHGYADGTFRPNQTVTRGELSAFLYRFASPSQTQRSAGFTDVKQGDTFHEAIAWMQSTGEVNGYQDGSFKPYRNITRGEASALFYASVPKVYAKTNMFLYRNPRFIQGENISAVVPQAPMVVVENPSLGRMLKVRVGGSVGWVNKSLVSSGKPGTHLLEHPEPETWLEASSNNVSPWCWGVVVRQVPEGRSPYATFSKVRHGTQSSDDVTVHEFINLTPRYEPNHGWSRAVQYHECAHILQFRAYDYDMAALRDGARKNFPGRLGMENMADCMADAMGAWRHGDGWSVGYGGTCSPTQMADARKVIAGQKV